MRQVEAVVVERYPRWVRLAYLTLPAGLGRHTRVLRAHRAVQQSLNPAGRRVAQGADPLDALRAEVLRRAAGRMLPLPPWVGVWGLRIWPSAEGLDEASRDLAALPAFARAAHVLCRWDGLSEEHAARILASAGAPDPAGAVRVGFAVIPQNAAVGERDAVVHPGHVHTRPADLLLRRARARTGWAGLGVLALCAALATASGGGGAPAPGPYAGAPAARAALDPGRLVRVPGPAWSDTGRLDFTAWPARGDRTADRALLARALATWGTPPAGATITAAPATSTRPPLQAPQLLYAGQPEKGVSVVVLLDADGRLVRYTERGTARSMDFAQTNDAGVTTAASVVLLRGDVQGKAGPAVQLLAPWIATAAVRDLNAPSTPARPLPVAGDGTVTLRAGGGTGCATAPEPALEVASSARIVEKHAFLLADLGGLLPVHLTYTPLPEAAGVAHARQPREATGSAALERWAREACVLREVDGRAVRSVNLWDFARADLPEGAGQGLWSCVRATHWTGRGDVVVRLRPPGGGQPVTAAKVPATAACGRFGQHVLAAAVWRAPSGRAYQLAAGSREVSDITASGSVRARATGRTFAAPAAPPGATPPVLTARLHSGTSLTALDGESGGRD
ncbi:hypothetical protein ACTVZO_38195 [Streptomyces sp. IBSNAI002]|uniref:hypothetical protein n=1 Tax=Streptomyces sp. IBSNAI002 TaxID=3457500 RepID=UPI003FD29BE8